jgi:hypothetical protein
MLVATGYGKWGLTNGSAAGLALADTVTATPADWAHVCQPAHPHRNVPHGTAGGGTRCPRFRVRGAVPLPRRENHRSMEDPPQRVPPPPVGHGGMVRPRAV